MQVLTSEGEYWAARWAGRVIRVRDGKGIRYLSLLLAHPGRRLAVSTLCGDVALGEDARRAEQDRVNVTKAIRAAIRRIAVHHPDLGTHLEESVQTGAYCAYVPVVSRPVDPRPDGAPARRP